MRLYANTPQPSPPRSDHPSALAKLLCASPSPTSGCCAPSLPPSRWVSEQMGGLSYLEFIRGLAKRVESDWAGVMADLEAIRSSLLTR